MTVCSYCLLTRVLMYVPTKASHTQSKYFVPKQGGGQSVLTETNEHVLGEKIFELVLDKCCRFTKGQESTALGLPYPICTL